MTRPGCSLQLGDSPHAADLEITRFGQRQPNVSCAPALLAIVAPLIGAVTATARPTKPTNVDVTGRPPVIVMPFNLKVSVVRPSDLLVLEFEFVNLKYTTGTPPSLVRNDPKSPAYIIVHFPPQNIAERAFGESPDTPNSNEPPTAPPIPSRMAGPSRLVFRVPDTTTDVPYTLNALLDWKRYEPSLVPVALPPPQTYTARVPVMSQAIAGLEMNRSRVRVTGQSSPEARTFSSAAVSGAKATPPTEHCARYGRRTTRPIALRSRSTIPRSGPILRTTTATRSLGYHPTSRSPATIRCPCTPRTS